MGDFVRMITASGAAVCYSADTTDMVAQAEAIHKTSAVVTAALGRLMTAASIIGAGLKGEGNSVTLRVKADGPTGAVIAVADSNGNVKGYVQNPVVELPLNQFGKLDVSGAVGKNGSLYVMKDLGLKEPYMGMVPLVSGEIAEDITSYFATSEQTPSVCALGVLVNPDLTVRAAGGFLVQLLPGAVEEDITKLEQNVAKLRSVTQMLE
ncbi:MAG: Hsp33 family molecular chaperone HslO, partial [Angelakisella sp.]